MRTKWRLHQDWYFIEADVAEDFQIQGANQEIEQWQKVTVPHTFRLEPYAHRGITTAQGIATYVKYFPLAKELENRHLYLTFEAVMGVTDVWLNGVHLFTNYGGYLPFVICLDQVAYFDGRENTLVVRADNQDNGQVPPGKPQELLDFTYFGGMYRDVWLEAVSDIYITDPLYEMKENQGGIILEYPLVSKEKAIVSTRVQLRSTRKEDVQTVINYKILDTTGNCVVNKEENCLLEANRFQEIETIIEIDYPFLWELEKPSLYRLMISVYVGGERIDFKETNFGIRKIEVDRAQGIFINGVLQPFLSGVNRHQDYPVIGNAAPASMQRRDAILIKEAGFQVVRGAHYPMSESFLDACDELGLLVFEATPGWQWYPTNNPEPFSSRVRENIRQMVRRDRNHPCILAYETVLNETYHVPYGFSKESARIALAEQKEAKVTAESYGYDASPEANGIDREAEFVYGFQDPLAKTEKAVMFLREYTDSYIEYYGDFNSRRVTRGVTDGFYPSGEARNLVKANQMLFRNLPEDYSLARCYKIRAENPAFIGAAIWTGIDSRGAGSLMSPCGIWDGYRLPKTSYWAYASQQVGKDILYIASEWTENAPVLDKNKTLVTIGCDDFREVYVYSNVAKVILTVEKHGQILWESKQQPYLKEDANYLPHPPFYFSQVPYVKGSTLCAKGINAEGEVILKETRETAGKPHSLRVSADTLGVPVRADGNDLVLVRAEILDKDGNLCTNEEQKIFFTIEGDAAIVGDGNLLAATNPAWAEAGIASIYLQAGCTPGKVSVCAVGKNLAGGKEEILILASEDNSLNNNSCSEIKEYKSSANLSQHEMSGVSEYVPNARLDGNIYPESILLKEEACWILEGETHFQTICQVISGDKKAELLIYLDDVLRYKGSSNKVKLCVEGAKEMRLRVYGSMPTEIILLSPYLWNEKIDEEVTELTKNIAFGKPACASVNSEEAEKVWQEGVWFGLNPRDGIQEWEIDLEDTYNVRNAKVLVGGQMGSDCTFYQYEIYTSADKVNWEKQVENTRTSWTNGVLDYFTAQQVRYVKVVFTGVDGTLYAGIQKFELYQDYGVDSVNEYALSGILVENNVLVFEPNRLVYKLPEQEELTIQTLAFDPNAKITISGVSVEEPEIHKISNVQPVKVQRKDCDGVVEIKVESASGKGLRIYKLIF